MQFLVVGLVAGLLEQRCKLRLAVRNRLNQLGVAGGAEAPDQRPQRIDLGVGLIEQAFDLFASFDACEYR
jgi:hypothetical protein